MTKAERLQNGIGIKCLKTQIEVIQFILRLLLFL